MLDIRHIASSGANALGLIGALSITAFVLGGSFALGVLTAIKVVGGL